jgi:hypothetical protein
VNGLASLFSNFEIALNRNFEIAKTFEDLKMKFYSTLFSIWSSVTGYYYGLVIIKKKEVLGLDNVFMNEFCGFRVGFALVALCLRFSDPVLR